MAYEVLYFDMPMYKAKCQNLPASLSCNAPYDGVLEDATWGGLRAGQQAITPDIIAEHQVADNCSLISDSRSSSNYSAPDDPDIELPNTIGEAETWELHRRFRRLTRSLSIRQGRYQEEEESRESSLYLPSNWDQTTSEETTNLPLFDCIFTTGLCHDRTLDEFVPFTRDSFPDGFRLPPGIEELCWPDAMTWQPHSSQNRTYNLVLTDFRGQRTFGYCRRIQAEGIQDGVPLAICILTRHARARGLFSQILTELIKLYGLSSYSMRDIYRQLHSQPFPSLGASLEIAVTKFEYRQKSRMDQRRGSLSLFLQTFNSSSQKLVHPAQLGPQLVPSSTRVKRIKRPIDFRTDGAPICRMLTISQIFLLYATVLQERRLVVISTSLSDLSALFDAIESLLFPLMWQHTLIPALPPNMTALLEAPTPYLIGVLVEETSSLEAKASSLLYEESLQHDRDCLVVQLAISSSHSRVIKKPRSSSLNSKSFFPSKMVEKLLLKLQKLEELCKEDEVEESYRHHQFVLICESFLQMYSSVFLPIQDYILRPGQWSRKSHPYVPVIDEEFNDFHLPDYISSLDPDLQSFVQKLSQTSLFEEYLRNRIRSLGIQVLSNTADTFKLRRRKWRRKKVQPQQQPQQVNSHLSSLRDQNSKLQRRITFPMMATVVEEGAGKFWNATKIGKHRKYSN